MNNNYMLLNNDKKIKKGVGNPIAIKLRLCIIFMSSMSLTEELQLLNQELRNTFLYMNLLR